MVGSIGSTSNLISMILLSYQQRGMSSQGTQGIGAPPPPDNSKSSTEDPLGVFNTVDSDSDNSISGY